RFCSYGARHGLLSSAPVGTNIWLQELGANPPAVPCIAYAADLKLRAAIPILSSTAQHHDDKVGNLYETQKLLHHLPDRALKYHFQNDYPRTLLRHKPAPPLPPQRLPD